MLAVVEHQQKPAVDQVFQERLARRSLRIQDAKWRRPPLRPAFVVRKRRQVHPPDTVAKIRTHCSAIRRASRVFPLPPTPVSVTSLLDSSSRASFASSSTRPTKLVRVTGRFAPGCAPRSMCAGRGAAINSSDGLDRGCGCTSMCIAFACVLCERPPDDSPAATGEDDLEAMAVAECRIAALNSNPVFPLEWQSTHRHFVEHDAKRPNIASRIRRLRAKQLRRHVRQRPGDRLPSRESLHCRLGQLADTWSWRGTREPEVEHLDPPLRCHHHIAALQIAMNEAVRMGVRERLCDLAPVSEQISSGSGCSAINPLSVWPLTCSIAK